MNDRSATAPAASASDGRDTRTSSGAAGLAVRPSTARVATTWSGSTRTYTADGGRSSSTSVCATAGPDQRRLVELGREDHRVEDPDDRERPAAERHVDAVGERADAEPPGGRRAEHDRRVALRRRVEPPPLADRRGHRVEQVEVGRDHGDAAGLALGDLVGPAHGRVDRAGRPRPRSRWGCGRSSRPTRRAACPRRRRAPARARP